MSSPDAQSSHSSSLGAGGGGPGTLPSATSSFTDEEPEVQRGCFVKVMRLPAADLV